jgi:hypothetical protein
MAEHLAAARVMPTNKTAVYLYCVVRSARRPSLAGASSGVPSGTAPAAHKVTGNLWMIVAEVPLDVYGPASLESRLRDLDWVAAVAVAHEAIVERFTRARGSVVVPAKLFTMFSTLEKALDDVTGRRAEIQRVMKRIEGCEEWGIRITRQAVMPPTGADASAASGAAFLLARKAARDAVVTARAQASAAAETAFVALARLSRDATQRERRSEPGTNPPVLEAAFLVAVTSRARFKAEAFRQTKACAVAGADLALTGPWPAYNFIGQPTSSDVAS